MNDSQRHQRLTELFAAMYELPPGQRGAALDALSGDDAALRDELENLLRRHDLPKHILDQQALGPGFSVRAGTTRLSAESAMIGRQIGQYRLKRIIASGGMGVVYEALQEKPRRTVALKVMRQGLASASALRRFEYESQVLGRLRHPGIAQVFEAGTCRDGGVDVPYFAMEYVPNARALTDFVRERRLSTAQRLLLFEKVCDAVHHGHQKGVIHRDLKPANILVDSAGEPKIIDFGVARSTDSDLAVTTLQTDVGQLIGTLQYMSPEQCDADPHDLDTRSDIYALGVVLYELLCDRLPYEVSHAGLHEAVRVVKETAPQRPSTLNRLLRGDLETITLKAMEKDRLRRYQSAADLAADLVRYRRSEPILAVAPSSAYRLRKFLHRHRLGVGASAAVLTLLLAGIAGTSWQAYRATDAESRATTLAGKEAAQRTIAEQRQREAEWSGYASSLAAGNLALTALDPATARAHLQRAPERLRGWEWRYLWNQADASSAAISFDEPNGNAAAFDADSTRLAVCAGRTCIVRSLADNRVLASIQLEAMFYAVAFDPRSDRFATADSTGSVRIWSGEGAPVAQCAGHARGVFSVAFSPDGTRLVSGAEDQTVRVWSTADWSCQATLKGHSDSVRAVAWTPDGSCFASASYDSTILLWDGASLTPRATLRGHAARITAMSFRPDGQRLASCSLDGTLRLWNVADGAGQAIAFREPSRVYGVCFSPAGDRLAWCTASGLLRVWDVTQQQLISTLTGHTAAVMALAWSPNGQVLASTGNDRTIRLWDTHHSIIANLAGEHFWPVHCVAVSHDRRLIASGGGDKRLALRDARTFELLGAITFSGPVSALAFSDDDRWLAALVNNTTLVRVDLDSSDVTVLAKSLSYPALGVAGNCAAVSSDGDPVRVFDLTSGVEIATLPVTASHMTALVMTDDGTRLACAGNDRSFEVWSVPQRTRLLSVALDDDPVRLAVHALAGRAAIAGANGGIVVHDLITGRRLHSVGGPALRADGVLFNDDGTRLFASAIDDDAIRAFDVASGDLLLAIRTSGHAPGPVAWLDDHTLLSGGNDRLIRIWSDAAAADRHAALRTAMATLARVEQTSKATGDTTQPADSTFEALMRNKQLAQRLRERERAGMVAVP